MTGWQFIVRDMLFYDADDLSSAHPEPFFLAQRQFGTLQQLFIAFPLHVLTILQDVTEPLRPFLRRAFRPKGDISTLHKHDISKWLLHGVSVQSKGVGFLAK